MAFTGIAGGPAAAALHAEEIGLLPDHVVEGVEIGPRGLALDAAGGVQALGRRQARQDGCHVLCRRPQRFRGAGILALAACPQQQVAGVLDLGGDDRPRDGQAGGGRIGKPILLPPQQDVTRDGRLDPAQELRRAP